MSQCGSRFTSHLSDRTCTPFYVGRSRSNPLFSSALHELHLDHPCTEEPFAALGAFKNLVFRAGKKARLLACAALRAVNQQLQARRSCCEAWAPVVRCFDSTTLRCTGFRALCNTIASLRMDNLREHEEGITSQK